MPWWRLPGGGAFQWSGNPADMSTWFYEAYTCDLIRPGDGMLYGNRTLSPVDVGIQLPNGEPARLYAVRTVTRAIPYGEPGFDWSQVQRIPPGTPPRTTPSPNWQIGTPQSAPIPVTPAVPPTPQVLDPLVFEGGELIRREPIGSARRTTVVDSQASQNTRLGIGRDPPQRLQIGPPQPPPPPSAARQYGPNIVVVAPLVIDGATRVAVGVVENLNPGPPSLNPDTGVRMPGFPNVPLPTRILVQVGAPASDFLAGIATNNVSRFIISYVPALGGWRGSVAASNLTNDEEDQVIINRLNLAALTIDYRFGAINNSNGQGSFSNVSGAPVDASPTVNSLNANRPAIPGRDSVGDPIAGRHSIDIRLNFTPGP